MTVLARWLPGLVMMAVLAALALTVAYGLTPAGHWPEPLVRAVAALLRSPAWIVN